MKGSLWMEIRNERKKGLSYTEIARKHHIDPRTAKKYAESDTKPVYTLTVPKPSKLDPYKHLIDMWLEEALPIISTLILSTGFCGLQCSELSFEYMASYISNSYFEIHKDMLAHGATQEAVNNDDLTGMHIVIPDDKVLRNYHKITQPICAQISKNICENQELIKLRDWLLPMLMNGQATVSD